MSGPSPQERREQRRTEIMARLDYLAREIAGILVELDELQQELATLEGPDE